MDNYKSIISKAIEEYNHYRSPEVIAEILHFHDREFTVKLRGPFCSSCGVYDYFEDLIYTLKRGGNTDIAIVKVEDVDEGFKVTYHINQPKE